MKKIHGGENGGGERSNSQTCSPSTLPDEILYEILTRVNLDVLLQSCRKVCREWQALTYDSTFRSLHLQRTRSVSGYFIQFIINNTSQIWFVSPFSKHATNLPKKFTWIKAATYQAQGLVCCLNKIDFRIHRYYVCKPRTRQAREIPDPKSGCYNERMAMMVMKSNPLHYKIIRFSDSIGEELGLKYCEIFDSKNWAWRIHSKLKTFPNFDLEPELLLHGSFHWLTLSEQIFVFDVIHEDWRFIMLPQLQSPSALENMKYDKKLVDCEGKLGVLYSPRLGQEKGKGSLWIELWVMEDYLKETWKKKYRVSLEPLSQFPQPCSILALDNMTNSILVRAFDGIIWYNFITGAHTRVKKLQNPISTLVRSIHSFNSDFLPCSSLDQEDEPEEEADPSK